MALIELSRGGRPLYRVRWNYRDPSIDGKPYDQREFRDLKAATDWHKRTRRQRRTTTGNLKVKDIAEEWLNDHVGTIDPPSTDGLELRTRQDYHQAVRIRINPGLGSRIADELTPAECSAWLKNLLRTGYAHLDHTGKRKLPPTPSSVPTANKTLRIAKAMMRWARGEGLTTCRAFEDVRGARDRRSLDERRPQARAYTDAEMTKLRRACRTLLEETLIVVGADSGLRRSELFALHWSSVDFKASTIRVEHSLDADGSYKDPKTHERRTVPLWADGLKALKEWRKHAPDVDLVFPSREGKPLHTTWDSRHAPGIRERSGIHLQLNELRDTYASELFAAGASDAEVSIAMGHRSVETTRRHYGTWIEPSRAGLAKRVNEQRRQRRKSSTRLSTR